MCARGGNIIKKIISLTISRILNIMGVLMSNVKAHSWTLNMNGEIYFP